MRLATLLLCVAAACTPASAGPTETPISAPEPAREPMPVSNAEPVLDAEPVPNAAPDVAPAPEPEPEPEPPIAWADLQPIAYAKTRGRKLFVELAEHDRKTIKALPSAHMSYEDISIDDPRVPARARAVPEYMLLSPEGVSGLGEPAKFGYAESYFGFTWIAQYPTDRPREQSLIALPRAPHSTAAFRLAPKPKRAHGHERSQLAWRFPKDRRPTRDDTITFQDVEIHGPNGATQLLAAWWEHMDIEVMHKFVVLRDAEGKVVMRFATREFDAWLRIDWVADLDGDGVDEIGWGGGGIEDAQYRVTHFAGDKVEHVTIYEHGH